MTHIHVCMYGILTYMYYKDLPNVGIPYMKPMGDRDYYVAITMVVCECACLYKQKCVVRASLDIFLDLKVSLKERFKLSISVEVPSYQVFNASFSDILAS